MSDGLLEKTPPPSRAVMCRTRPEPQTPRAGLWYVVLLRHPIFRGRNNRAKWNTDTQLRSFLFLFIALLFFVFRCRVSSSSHAERWLGRASLRQTAGDDPIIPSEWWGDEGRRVVDPGLIRDLARTLPSRASAERVADALTQEAAKQTRARMTAWNADDHDLGALRQHLKGAGRAVQAATKTATVALKQHGANTDGEDNAADNAATNDTDSDHVALLAALASLQRATSALQESTTKVQRVVGGGRGSKGTGEGTIVFNGARRAGIYDVMVCGPGGKPRRPYLTVSSLHLSKLLRLWQRHGPGETKDTETTASSGDDPIVTMTALVEDDRVLFQKSVYCLLARYEALKGAGFQCAVPGVAFEAAAECGLGTTIECFASPLNCRYERFCSAFPDVEHRFGSLGSFFDDTAFDPVEGSFEANPPFVPEIMVAMGEKLERLLSDTHHRGPLSFLVVVPAWGAGIEFIQKLEVSAHLRASLRVKACDHAFCDGAQHTKTMVSKKKKGKPAADPDMRPSSWDTAVLLLQNDAGAIKWNVDGATLENAFCNALKAALRTVPTNRSTLEGWEKRGVGQGGTQPRVKYGQRHPQSSGNKRPLFVRDEQSRTGNHKRQNI